MDTARLIERLPPQHLEAEQAVLGSLMVAPEMVDAAREILAPEDFYREAHGTIFDAILDLDRCGENVDILTVRVELERRERLDLVGGFVYLRLLLNSVPTAAHLEHYARIVAAAAFRRRLITAAEEVTQLAYDLEPDVRAVADRAEGAIFQVCEERRRTGPVALRELLTAALARAEQAMENPGTARGVPSGIALLDRWTGGWQSPDFIVLAGRPGMGKTSAGLQFAGEAGAADRGAVLIFSMEMSREQVAERFLSAEARVDSMSLRRGDLRDCGFGGTPDWTNIIRASGKLGDRPIYVEDRSDLTPIEVRSACRRIAKSHGGLALVVIDYLQLMHTDGRAENRTQEIAAVARALKGIAKEMRVPVLALSQLNRGVEGRGDKRPLLSDLRDSGGVEQEADLVLMLYRPRYYQREGDEEPTHLLPDLEAERAELIVSKHRNGPSGTIPIAFLRRYVRYDNLEESQCP
jgi:replicative DNA helicase